MDNNITFLLDRIKVQNGESPLYEELEKEINKAWNKIKWNSGVDFGSKVKVVFDDGLVEHGYLFTIPPYTDIDVDGCVHLPHTYGEKCDSGPVWMTLTDISLIDSVKEIIVG